MGSWLITDSKYNCSFFPITKVYFGNRMEPNERKKLIEICKTQDLSYQGIIIKKYSYKMCDCQILCENCNFCSDEK